LPLRGGGNGFCPPPNEYAIYNYYCNNSVIELALQAAMPCSTSRITSQTTSIACDYVEAFIDTMTTTLSDIKPVFYRCYWYSPTPSTSFETVEFEWSATAEYIIWYINNINGNGNSVNDIITGLPNYTTPVGVYVPLLKVTNHSPSSF
jgi:hypothetical protein